jgi:hypothetical protein
MRIHVDDGEILVAALGCLLGCVRQQLAGIELLDLHAPKVAEWEIHDYCS